MFDSATQVSIAMLSMCAASLVLKDDLKYLAGIVLPDPGTQKDSQAVAILEIFSLFDIILSFCKDGTVSLALHLPSDEGLAGTCLPRISRAAHRLS